MGFRPRRPAPQQAGASVGARRHPGRAQPRRRRRRPGGRRGRGLQPRSRRQRRARQALLAPVLERRRGPGEADFAAVAAPDGTVGVLLRRATGSATSCATGEPGGDPVPIERIDHITLAQPFEAFDEAGLFYRSVLDLQPSESQELAAPDGLVRSRAVASGDGRVRVVLNVPALAGTAQGELQHVAFACSDALATARAMRDRGVPLLRRRRTTTTTTWRRGWSWTPHCWPSCGSSACSTTAVRTESSCTSTRPRSAGACSSRCSSDAAATAATAPSTHPSGWPRSARSRHPSR